MTAVLIIAASAAAVYIIGVCVIFCIAAVRTPEPPTGLAAIGGFSEEISAGIDWIKARNCERVEIRSYDGLRLAARLLPCDNAKGTIILMHGYRAPMYRDFACAYEYFSSLGFSLLIPSQRAHGESEGRFICYGIKERFDCLGWARYIHDRFGTDKDIFLDGLSMGSSTVLMASSLELPENVRGILSDSGFTSVRDELKYLIRRHLHLPPGPILFGVNILTRLIAGYSLNECSTLDCVARTEIPILFVHGTADTFVPHEFGEANYSACASEKKLVLVDGAGHGLSFLTDKPRCKREIEAFFKRCSVCEK